MLKVGLTGGMASGKSTVTAMLAAKGAKTRDSDALVHRALKKGSLTRQRLIKEFGPQILLKTKEIDRNKLAQIVFNQPKQRRKLEQIVHPPVVKEIRAWLSQCRKLGNLKIAVAEVPLLFEARLEKMFDVVVAVTAPRKCQITRFVKKGYSRKQALSRIRSQMSQTEKAKKSNYVIRNNGSKKELKTKVDKLWEKLKQE